MQHKDADDNNKKPNSNHEETNPMNLNELMNFANPFLDPSSLNGENPNTNQSKNSNEEKDSDSNQDVIPFDTSEAQFSEMESTMDLGSMFQLAQNLLMNSNLGQNLMNMAFDPAYDEEKDTHYTQGLGQFEEMEGISQMLQSMLGGSPLSELPDLEEQQEALKQMIQEQIKPLSEQISTLQNDIKEIHEQYNKIYELLKNRNQRKS